MAHQPTQGGDPGGSPPNSDTDWKDETIRRLSSEVLVKTRQVFLIGLCLTGFGVLLICAALTFFFSVLPRLDREAWRTIEVEKGTGIVRMVQTLDGPINPDARVRGFFITQVVNDFETVRKSDANERLARLRQFIPASKNELFEAHYRKVAQLLGDSSDRERKVVMVGPITPTTEHKSGSAINQSITDVTIEVTRQGGVETHELRVTIEYRFLGYTNNLESNSPDMEQKIRNNPLGMEVVGYHTELKIPPRKVDKP